MSVVCICRGSPACVGVPRLWSAYVGYRPPYVFAIGWLVMWVQDVVWSIADVLIPWGDISHSGANPLL